MDTDGPKIDPCGTPDHELELLLYIPKPCVNFLYIVFVTLLTKAGNGH